MSGFSPYFTVLHIEDLIPEPGESRRVLITTESRMSTEFTAPSSPFHSSVLHLSWQITMTSSPWSPWYSARFKLTSFPCVDTAFQSEPLLQKRDVHHNGNAISWFLSRPWHTHPTGLGPGKEDAKSYSWSLRNELLFSDVCVLFLCFGVFAAAPSQWKSSVFSWGPSSKSSH